MDKLSLHLLNSFSGEQLLGKSITHDYLRPKKSPLFHLHQAEGAQFISFGEHLWVERYDNLDREYEALHHHVAMVDVSMVTMVKICGESVLEDLQACFSNTIVTDKNFILKYGGLISHDGRLFDDGLLFIKSPQEVLLTLNVSFYNFQRFIKNHEWSQNLEITDITNDFGKIQLQGPNAPQILNYLFPDLPPLPFFRFIERDNGFINASGFSRAAGYELFFPMEKTEKIWRDLRKMGIKPYGISTMEVSRLEAKMICCGHEFASYQYYPEEIGFVLSPKHLSQNMDSHIIFFTLDPDTLDMSEVPRIGDVIIDKNNETQGIITSFAYSPLFRSFIGFSHLLTPLSAAARDLFYKGKILKPETLRIFPHHKTAIKLTS